jgi:hypothetical protein
VLPFYDWLRHNGARQGIDVRKPMMISEAGSVVFGDAPVLTAAWYAQIPQVLQSHPQLRAIGLWDRPGNGACDYQFDDHPLVRATIARVGLSAPIWPS